MAIIYELWAECSNHTHAQQFAQHFDGLQHTLLSGRTIQWTASLEPEQATTVPVFVSSQDIGGMGVRTLQDALDVTEAGLRLYHHLLTAPSFRFARAAWEAECIPMRDLSDYIEIFDQNKHHLFLTCVIDDALFHELGKPVEFVPFSTGYWWKPYNGEAYNPLHSNDQLLLNQLCLQLFPKIFSR